MKTDRLEFYDPLYETIIFERGLPAGGFNLEDNEPLDSRDFVQSAEFSRLAFLRQAGLAWLVFPSATHTRFAHSIGCWWLGRIAESLIRVRMGRRVGRGVSLRWWLDQVHLREEFYLGLLLHDVGHGPLSHVLERNSEFCEGLRSAGLESTEHEERGAMLLRGEGVLSEMWSEVAPQRYGSVAQTFSMMKEKLVALDDYVCIDAVCYLMTGNRRYLNACKHSHQEGISVVKELVSGLLDLDRLDHYARDSYFSGLRQVAVNVPGFLSNLRVKIPDRPGEEEPLLSLTHHGASYAASLLFSKRQILSTMFRNQRTLALHAMANWAVSAYLRELGGDSERGRGAVRMALMEDDELFEALSSSLNGGCRDMLQRIRSIRPYVFVGRWSQSDLATDADDARNLLIELEKVEDQTQSPRFLVYMEDGFWEQRRPPEPRDWLDTGHLLMEDTGEFLTQHPDHRSDFAHLRDGDHERCIWVFAREEANVEAGRSAMGAVVKKAKG